MTHLEELLTRWDFYSKGESATTRQIREAIKKDKEEAERFDLRQIANPGAGTQASPGPQVRS